MFYLLFALGYFSMGYIIGKGMFRQGFAGSEDTVRFFGGIMWPITIWLLLLAVAGSEKVKD